MIELDNDFCLFGAEDWEFLKYAEGMAIPIRTSRRRTDTVFSRVEENGLQNFSLASFHAL